MNDIFSGSKLFRHLDRALAWQRGETVPPVTVEFDVTGRCNHHCRYCSGGYRCGDVPRDVAESRLRQVADFGARGIIFTGGGEPLMHPDCASLVEYARQCGPEVGFITNGSLMTEADAERIASVCTWARVSIDASNQEVYRHIHGADADAFARAWRAVERLAAARDRKRVPCTVGVGYLVGTASLLGMLAATKRAKAAGADYIQFRPFHREHLRPEGALFDCQAEAEGRFHVLASTAKYSRMDKSRGYRTCHAAAFIGIIQADDNMPLCCHLRGHGEWYLGNLGESTFRTVWTGPRRDELLAKLDVSECLPLCRNDPLNAWLENACTPQSHESFL